MKYLLLTLVLLLLACAPGHEDDLTGPGPEPAGDLLLVANKTANTLTFYDAKTLAAVGETTTGAGPHEVAVTPDGAWAFVSNYEGPGDSISRIDVARREEERRLSIDPYRQPHGIVANAAGTRIYATVEGSRAVIEVDVETGDVVRAIETGQEVTHMVVLTPDESKLYTANIGSGTVTAVDLGQGVVLAQIPTGAGAEGIDVSPDGREVWVTNRAADTVSVIDTATDRVVATLPAPGFPIRVKLTPDGRWALVSCATANTVRVFDTAGRDQLTQIDIGATPVGVLVTPEGERAFVANTQDDTVTVLDLERMVVATTLRAGSTPDGMAYARGR